MRLIKLTQGKFAQVDDKNYDWLNTWNWYAWRPRNTYYAVRNINIDGKREIIRMHRLIMNTPEDKQVDHQDHNGLNCQEYNMRNCTHHQNQMNKTPWGKSKYLGVGIRATGRRKGDISAQIKINYKSIYLGTFLTEVEAAKAYDKAALEHFGEFANLNFKP